MNVPLLTEVFPVIAAPPLKVANPATSRVPEFVIETLLEWVVVKPAVVNAAPLTVSPPTPVINPPTANPLVIDSLPTVRFVTYALIVSIIEVDKPPCRVVKFGPITVNVPLLTEVFPVIAAPPPAVSNPPTLKIPASEAFPIVREPIYAEAVLIVVVEIPAVVKVSPRIKDPINAFDTLIVEITP